MFLYVQRFSIPCAFLWHPYTTSLWLCFTTSCLHLRCSSRCYPQYMPYFTLVVKPIVRYSDSEVCRITWLWLSRYYSVLDGCLTFRICCWSLLFEYLGLALDTGHIFFHRRNFWLPQSQIWYFQSSSLSDSALFHESLGSDGSLLWDIPVSLPSFTLDLYSVVTRLTDLFCIQDQVFPDLVAQKSGSGRPFSCLLENLYHGCQPVGLEENSGHLVRAGDLVIMRKSDQHPRP